MSSDKEVLIKKMIKFGKEAEKKNLIWGPSGNISHKMDEDSYIITGSGAYLGVLNNEDFVVVDLKNKTVEGEAKPSIESKMHTGIYKIQDGAKSVFHSQPFFTTLISCTDLEVDTRLFPESMAYIDRIGRVQYNHPGSQKFADSVSERARECDTIILSNHGAICWGNSLENVLLKTESLELLCKLVAFSRVTDLNLNFLPQDLKEEFLKHLSELK
jgi:L-fuculose-phosphate aldolase